MFRIEPSSDPGLNRSSSPPLSSTLPPSPPALAASRRSSRHTTPPQQLQSERPPRRRTSSSSDGVAGAWPDGIRDDLAHQRPPTGVGNSHEVDEIIQYFDSLSLSSKQVGDLQFSPDDLFYLIFSSQNYFRHSREIVGDIHAFSMLAITAARMSADIPSRREEFEIKATKYMQPSLLCLRSQFANSDARSLTDRQILVEMLLHCVTNWYLLDLTAAQTHLNAIGWFTRCLDDSNSSDRKLKDIIRRCNTGISDQRAAQQECRRSGLDKMVLPSSVKQEFAMVV